MSDYWSTSFIEHNVCEHTLHVCFYMHVHLYIMHAPDAFMYIHMYMYIYSVNKQF